MFNIIKYSPEGHYIDPLPTPVSALIHAAKNHPYFGLSFYTMPISLLLLSATLEGITICPAIPFLGATLVTVFYYSFYFLSVLLFILFVFALVYIILEDKYTIIHHIAYTTICLILVLGFLCSFISCLLSVVFAF